jgi:hypothetical protein
MEAEMRAISRVVAVGLGALFLFVFMPVERADAGCFECNAIRRGCRVEAALNYVGCVTGCPRDDAEAFRACRDATCRPDRTADRLSCQVQVEACVCPEGENGEACGRACTDVLRECLKGDLGVRETRKSCMQGCRDTARSGREGCKAGEPAERGQCFGAVGAELGACLGGCAADAAVAVGVCTDNLRSCVEGCASQTP